MLQQHLGSRAVRANPRASEGWLLQLIRLAVVLISRCAAHRPTTASTWLAVGVLFVVGTV